MDLKAHLEQLGDKIENYKSRVTNEEMTKTAFIMPFFDLLGYDTRDPFQFVPEFTADVAGAKGEKVDYAIFVNDELEILVEAKHWEENLEKHDKQLIRYFNVTDAKIAILTNGIDYRFYTDLEDKNKMDKSPFLEFSLTDLRDRDITEIKKFIKSNFDTENILNSAEELKYLTLVRANLKKEFESPSDNFVSVVIDEIFEGVKTAKVKDKFRPIVKKAISERFSEMLRDKLESALEEKQEEPEEIKEAIEVKETSNTTTTEEELDGFKIIKSILAEYIDHEKIHYKDTYSYFNILYEGNTRKWVDNFK